jgi:ATP-dependent protease ClpP protease subunit
MEFKYTQNPDADVPIMFIDKEIGGKDADGKDNIHGNDFLKELMYLSDIAGKKNICVWINSPGGIVTEGQSIYTAILNCKANVDTYCYGIAASIAGVIFQAGKRKVMASYASLMYHPAYSEDGIVDKALEALNKSICVMIGQRTGKTEDEVWKIMNSGKKDDKGTWMDADYALQNGFADAKDNAADKNSFDTRIKAVKYYNKILEENKSKRMNKILNKTLGLNEEASEAAAVAQVEALNKSLGDLKKAHQDAKDAYDKAKKELDEFKKQKSEDEDKAKADKAAYDEAQNKATADKLDKDADEEMKNAIKDGKIKNDAELIKSYKALLIKDFAGTKKVIDALPMSKTAAVFVAKDGDIKDSEAETLARSMGLKPGSAQWYNSIKNFNINNKNK